MDRSTLAEALDSVALQTYPNIEVVLVNAKDADHREVGERCGSFPIRMVGNNEQLDRSRAANVGLDNAIGQYLIFLDDDDLFYPEHIAVLVNALQTQNYSRCAYAGVRVEHYNEGILGTTNSLSQAFHWQKLWGRNYLPIHAALFERSLLNKGCRFDETLAVYEDWDFWVQVTQYTDLIHIDRITACYRNYGHSGFGLEADKIFIRKAKGIYFAKWKSIWSGEQISELIECREASLEQLQNRLLAQEAQCNEHKREITEHKQTITEYKQVVTNYKREIAKYMQDINVLYDSNSWKMTAPYRQVGLQAKRISRVLALSSRYARGAWPWMAWLEKFGTQNWTEITQGGTKRGT